MVRAGIVGISGYSGKVVFELLLKHSQARVTYVCANNTEGRLDQIWPQFKGRTDLVCAKFSVDKACELCDIIFLALPHTESMRVVPALLKKGKKVIDLSADYRLEDQKVYEKWYGHTHEDSKNLENSVYGLPELYREKIKKATLLANPGCYPTAAILGLAPLVATNHKAIQSMIIDAKSGVSGAGKKVVAELLFGQVDENFKAYKVLKHQHTPEINQYLSRLGERQVEVTFVAHLLPIFQGILETIYVQLNGSLSFEDITKIYQKFYKTETFVRMMDSGVQPEVKNVAGTNFCDIGLVLSEDKKTLVIVSVIDNLVKGAAGQAVQNFNIMNGFKETESLL